MSQRKPLPTHPALDSFFAQNLDQRGQLVCNENDLMAIREQEMSGERDRERQSSFERLTEDWYLRH